MTAPSSDSPSGGISRKRASPKKPSRIISAPPHDPSTPIARLAWVTRPQVTSLAKLGLITLQDLLEHFPRRHEDRRRFDHFPDAESLTSFCLCGTVGKTVLRRFGRMRSFEAELEKTPGDVLGGRITLRWFNLFHVQKSILTGSRLIVFGKPRIRGKRLIMEHPEFEIVSDEDRESIHLDRIVPIHPAGEGISVRVIRRIIHRALAETDWQGWMDTLPLRPSSWNRSLQQIHFPDEQETLESSRRELALRELLGIQILVLTRRLEGRKLRGIPKTSKGLLLDQFLKSLPFSLTQGQSEAIAAIRSDMGQNHRMQRLLQGDVGSGKTVVATAAMILAVESGHRALLMAPTQILAEQHFRNFRHWLNPLGITVELLTSKRKPSTAAMALIGTHALLHHEESLSQAGIVVIDEQHKFGVLQRKKISSGASAPDVLVMTATPIPRTLTQTIYGDLDLSLLRERPPGRGRVRTVARRGEKLPEITAYLLGELAKGRQAFIVYPLIEESEKLAAKAAQVEFDTWRTRLSPYTCSLLHGRMNAEEKTLIMDSFVQGSTQVLITTSVIEVGVDIPNATFLLVENAERFGLAQLHQLRGRIGRGIQTSTCVLIDGIGSPESHARLQILEQSDDGFGIAEEDLRLRGAGDILGTAQSGIPPLKIVDLFRDADLITEAESEATRILAEDPMLSKQQHASLLKLRRNYANQMITTTG